MLDIGFVEQFLVLDLALAGRIEDLLLDRRMHHKFGADLLDEYLLAIIRTGFFKGLE